ncbi:MAG: DUF4124 domain-containing protein [Myxococcales bacterium]|nr:DUF4124 domain-containing protein [Myxococcales bacterium]
MAAALLGGTRTGRAGELYRWVDKQGTVHFTDRPEDLPEPMRSKVLEEIQRREEAAQKKQNASPSSGTATPSPPPGETERLPIAPAPPIQDTPPPTPSLPPAAQAEPGEPDRAALREQWKKLADEARATIQNLEADCRRLEAEKDAAWNSFQVLVRPMDRQNAEKAEAALARCKEDLARARRYLDEELPRKARQANVPLYWLR